MKIKLDGLQLCTDCLFASVNGDFPEDKKRRRAVEDGLNKLGPYLVPNFNSETNEGISEFSWCVCDCCDSRLGGSRSRFAVLE